MRLLLFSIFFLTVWGPLSLEAYTDEILTTRAEIWEAVHRVLEPYGIRRADAGKYEIESRWIEDTVKRKRSVFPDQVGLNYEVQQTELRRYRIRVTLKEGEEATQVLIQGLFEEKPRNDRPQTPWHSVQPSSEDYKLERDLFFQILRQLGASRLETTPQPSG